jgi:tripartite-type tricarboxylate transporter receptor subunit TctC
LAEHLEQVLGQSVVVVNRPGAAGLIGAESVARATPDGRTLLASSVNLVIQSVLNTQSRLDPVQDFDHLSLTGTGYGVVTVGATSPFQTLEQLLSAMRRNPNGLNYGSGGVGSLAHFVGLAVLGGSGTTAVHVPYRGSVDLFPALERGDLAFACPVQSTAVPLIRQGKLRALAVSAARPSAALQGVPTLAQALGAADAVIEGWSGISAPKGLSPTTARRLHAAVLSALGQPAVQAMAAQADVPLVSSASPSDYRDFVAAERQKFARLARSLPAAD